MVEMVRVFILGRLIWKLGILLGGFVFVYLYLLPFMWSPPTVRVVFPPQVSQTQDFNLGVIVEAMHRNYQIQSVRFYVDHTRTTARGSKGIPETLQLYQNERPAPAPTSRISRLTKKTITHLDLSVPLSQLTNKGLCGPGVITGKVDVTLAYIPSTARIHHTVPGKFTYQIKQVSTDYTIQVQ